MMIAKKQLKLGIVMVVILLISSTLNGLTQLSDKPISKVTAQVIRTDAGTVHLMLLSQLGIGINSDHIEHIDDQALGFADEVKGLLANGNTQSLSDDEKALALTEARFVDHALTQVQVPEEDLFRAIIDLKYQLLNIQSNTGDRPERDRLNETINTLKKIAPLYEAWVDLYQRVSKDQQIKALANLNAIVAWYEQYVWQANNQSESLAKLMNDWSGQMNQDYERVLSDSYMMSGHDGDPSPKNTNLYISGTVKGQPVNWSLNQEVVTHDRVLVVVDAYQEINQTDGHLYIFTVYDGRGQVLHAKGRLDSLSLDFAPTENILLKESFDRLVQEAHEKMDGRTVTLEKSHMERGQEESKENAFSRPMTREELISGIVAQYGDQQDKTFLFATPATQRVFQHIAIPDALLANMTLEGQELATKFYGLAAGEGQSQLEILEIFVDSAATEIIIFAHKNGEKIVLVHSGQVLADGKIDFIEASDPILLQWYEE